MPDPGRRQAWLQNHRREASATRVTLISPPAGATAFGGTPQQKTYTVAGTFSVGMSEYDQAYHLHAAGFRLSCSSAATAASTS
jgi:hypothetical protein